MSTQVVICHPGIIVGLKLLYALNMQKMQSINRLGIFIVYTYGIMKKS